MKRIPYETKFGRKSAVATRKHLLTSSDLTLPKNEDPIQFRHAPKLHFQDSRNAVPAAL